MESRECGVTFPFGQVTRARFAAPGNRTHPRRRGKVRARDGVKATLKCAGRRLWSASVQRPCLGRAMSPRPSHRAAPPGDFGRAHESKCSRACLVRARSRHRSTGPPKWGQALSGPRCGKWRRLYRVGRTERGPGVGPRPPASGGAGPPAPACASPRAASWARARGRPRRAGRPGPEPAGRSPWPPAAETWDNRLGRWSGSQWLANRLGQASVGPDNEFTGVCQPGWGESLTPVWGPGGRRSTASRTAAGAGAH
jgi:hypothetical protein